MKRFENIFGGVKLTWGRVLLLSAITGAAVGLLMLPECLLDSSLQQPGISYEFWILFALFIALNCEKPLEAGLKTFVGFLISQPVIYLVQVPFSDMGWGLFNYYKTWIIPTVLTLPGGAVAWYVKKGSWMSVLILSIANMILCAHLPNAVLSLSRVFPKQIISTLFIAGEIVFFTLFLLRDKKKRIVSFALTAVMLALFSLSLYRTVSSVKSGIFETPEGRAPYELVTESEIFDVTFSEEEIEIEYRNVDVRRAGEEVIVYEDADGVQHKIKLTYGDGNVIADR